jgi:pimeloyl-ACP methyl ester carboxylesterase
MGAVLAAIAARDLGPGVVLAAVLLAPPFGERESVPGPFLQFLLRRRLLPPFLVRPRFFSANTPRRLQRAAFRAAVPEAPAIQALTFEKRWFHTDYFTEPLAQSALVIASEADRIVPVEQSVRFAEAIGARQHIFPAAEDVGHNDLCMSPSIVPGIVERIVGFSAQA